MHAARGSLHVSLPFAQAQQPPLTPGAASQEEDGSLESSAPQLLPKRQRHAEDLVRDLQGSADEHDLHEN